MLVYTPAGAPHRDHFEPRGRVIEGRFLTVSVPGALVDAAAREVAAGGRLPERSTALPHPAALAAAQRLAAACAAWAPDAPLVAEGLALDLLLAAAAHPDVPPGAQAGLAPPRWLAVARELLDDHAAGAAGPIDTADLARAAGVHPVHLARVFRRYLGCAPGDYLRRRRVERAAALLRATARPLADIALGCGFADQSHFARAFKRHTGVAPGAYRRRA
jgi:AraC family transcriptional regulator